MARAIQTAIIEVDVRHVLTNILAPTLILQRADNPYNGGGGEYVAEQIAGAKYVALPGVDLPYWVGDTGQMLDEIEEFLTGVRGGAGASESSPPCCSPTSLAPPIALRSLETDNGATSSCLTIRPCLLGRRR